MDLQQLLDALNEQTRKVNELRAKNERLRHALEKIIDLEDEEPWVLREIAQAALDAAGGAE